MKKPRRKFHKNINYHFLPDEPFHKTRQGLKWNRLLRQLKKKKVLCMLLVNRRSSTVFCRIWEKTYLIQLERSRITPLQNSSMWHAFYFKTTYQHVMLYYFYLTWCISAIYFICEKKRQIFQISLKYIQFKFIEDITSLILRPSTFILNISYTQYAINIPSIEVILITY